MNANQKVMTAMSGKGKELCDMLRREFGVPDRCTWFSVRFDHDDVVRVQCEYIPASESNES
ncbi:MAG: hypothetical protein H5U29_00230 [Pusillimonas sp.]|nr:hypothetical protein [Pusillimonas sp.]